MAGLRYLCCSDARRAALEQRPDLNGIDFLEVDDLDPTELDPAEAAEYAALPVAERDRLLWQRRLEVSFVNPLLPAQLASLTDANLRVTGGERPEFRSIALTVLATAAQSIVLRASKRGDFSVYRFSIVTPGDPDLAPPAVFDPLASAVDFSFKVQCPSDFDCAPERVCPPETAPPLQLDYLAKDYASFRRLMLDRMAALAPSWRERHAADLGITLVEVLAYAADYLSYRQDAVATEAYLGTARRRTSIRRHARLVDYRMHDGCNARVWVQVLLDASAPAAGVLLQRADPSTGVTTKFLSRVDADARLDADHAEGIVAAQKPEVFEMLDDELTLFPEHERLDFYTWGAIDCCLPEGATRATLAGRHDVLRPGDVLIFEELAGPQTGAEADADPSHRHAVRLTRVTHAQDPLGGRFADPPTDAAADVTEIEWGSADALPFALCVSATVPGPGGSVQTKAISAARGNIVLADHGRSVREPLSGPVPAPTVFRVPIDGGPCARTAPEPVPARYAPRLAQRPLTHGAPYDPTQSAQAAMRWAVADAVPEIELASVPATSVPWRPRRDLLGSSETATDFVVEVEHDLEATLRFGDDVHGRRPATGTTFTASYRVGNGTRGNVGAGAIAHVVTPIDVIAGARTPLPAVGGMEPETVADVRRFAPVAFRTQERAVTPDDYARMAERHPQVQRAAGTFRWTGSWRTVFVTADPLAAKDPDLPFDPSLLVELEPYRTAGHDLEVDTPRYVPLAIDMQVCAKRDYFRADVAQALLEEFSAHDLPDGRRGVLHPDNFTFGQPVYLSRLYAAAYAVDGVDSVKVKTFQRRDTPDPKPLADGQLTFDRLEIAQLDNDPSRPERGVFRLQVDGGK
jgi:hypothetical protein